MKNAVILSTFLCLPYFAQAAPMERAQATPLLEQIDDLNEQCRGGSGDDPRTMAACNKRDAFLSRLTKSGWCYGDDNQAGYQRYWKTCGEGRRQEVAQLKAKYDVEYSGTFSKAISNNRQKGLEWFKNKAYELDEAYTIGLCATGLCIAQKLNNRESNTIVFIQEKDDYRGRLIQGDYIRIVGRSNSGEMVGVRLKTD
ncbi:hypothetical protein [Pseudomonas oryzihabitans]|uniref:hypothetical protein n=1 Tax=Pseudomonas oryzihabitans TaxID=47885 RepID=UPI001DD63C9E|nr:hypothetical protein [Pseudomonas oryzihabitans]HJE71673.1 hypothetical protein [Pseudomonas oryzihabitans]